jgi:hypothetical protein
MSPKLIYVVIAFMLCSSVVNILLSRKRERRIRRYALNNGFSFCDDVLPGDFPLAQCDFSTSNWATKIRGAVTGKREDHNFLFFDWIVECGRNGRSYAQTVIAIPGNHRNSWVTRLDCSLTTEQADNWTVCYRRDFILPADEIDSLISSLYVPRVF